MGYNGPAPVGQRPPCPPPPPPPRYPRTGRGPVGWIGPQRLGYNPPPELAGDWAPVLAIPTLDGERVMGTRPPPPPVPPPSRVRPAVRPRADLYDADLDGPETFVIRAESGTAARTWPGADIVPLLSSLVAPAALLALTLCWAGRTPPLWVFVAWWAVEFLLVQFPRLIRSRADGD
jgi:hypothetical protein